MNKNGMYSALRYGAIGMEFAGIIVVAVIGGYKIDQYLGTSPWVMLLFIVGGFAGALQRLLWSLKRDTKQR